MTEAALDDVFIDDITFPADGRICAGRDAVPAARGQAARRPDQFGHRRAAQDLPRFAGYLARRGCAVLTYDYRGIGDSRQNALIGYNKPKSLVGFKATMSDWAALDITAAVTWMRERYTTCRSLMSAIPSAARRWDCSPTTPRSSARC